MTSSSEGRPPHPERLDQILVAGVEVSVADVESMRGEGGSLVLGDYGTFVRGLDPADSDNLAREKTLNGMIQIERSKVEMYIGGVWIPGKPGGPTGEQQIAFLSLTPKVGVFSARPRSYSVGVQNFRKLA